MASAVFTNAARRRLSDSDSSAVNPGPASRRRQQRICVVILGIRRMRIALDEKTVQSESDEATNAGRKHATLNAFSNPIDCQPPVRGDGDQTGTRPDSVNWTLVAT